MFCLPISGDLPHIRLTFGIFHKDKLGPPGAGWALAQCLLSGNARSLALGVKKPPGKPDGLLKSTAISW